MASVSEDRFYRKNCVSNDLVYYNVNYEQTDLLIGSNKNYSKIIFNMIKKYYIQLEQYVKRHEVFLHSLEPVQIDEDAPFIIKKMARASKVVGIGPMAGVAGAFSELIGQQLLKYSPEVIVENGGDIFISTKKERKIGIFAGNNNKLNNLAINIKPEYTPCGICTSSGKIGHSLSFGKCDAATILSNDTVLADSAATLAGNMLKSEDDMQNVAAKILSIKGIFGVVFVMKNKICVMGQVELVKI